MRNDKPMSDSIQISQSPRLHFKLSVIAKFLLCCYKKDDIIGQRTKVQAFSATLKWSCCKIRLQKSTEKKQTKKLIVSFQK